MELPLVSIAMAARNAESSIEASIRSLLRQTYQNWELIVIDDGSCDQTSRRIRAFRDDRIRLRVGERQVGLPARLNQAIDDARGKYIARMDADDVAYPERLERQVTYLERHPEVDLLGTGAMVFGENGSAVGIFPSRQTHEEICARPWAGFYLAHPSWMGRHEWFRDNRYSVDMQKAQDQELLLRAFRNSTFACLPEILIGYRQECLSLRKILRGRLNFCVALTRNAPRSCGYARTFYGVAGQVVKCVVDLAVISTGMGRVVLRHRARSPEQHYVEEWARVWSQCTSESCGQCAA